MRRYERLAIAWQTVWQTAWQSTMRGLATLPPASEWFDRLWLWTRRELPPTTWRNASLVAVGLTVASGVVRTPYVLPPAPPCRWVALMSGQMPSLATVGSFEEIRQVRDRLTQEAQRCQAAMDVATLADGYDPDILPLQMEALQRYRTAVEQRWQLELDAQRYWQQAQQQAQQAQKLSEGGMGDRNPDLWRQVRSHWQEGLAALQAIPPESLLHLEAIEATGEFQQQLDGAIREIEIAQVAQGFVLYGDTNRDGIADEMDYEGRQQWRRSRGALVLFNNDDDDRNGIPDWQDREVNGFEDAEDLAIVRLQLRDRVEGMQLFATVEEGDRPYVNLFQKTEAGWQPIANDGSLGLTLTQNVVLGVEAKQFAYADWDGGITLAVTATKGGEALVSDSVEMRVTPWLMLPNTAPVLELHASDRGSLNRRFVAQLQDIAPKAGTKLQAVATNTLWMQDTMEIGYVQFPRANELHLLPSALNGNRTQAEDTYAKTLLKPDFGWFQIGSPRYLNPADQWADWYGNLEVTPPLPGYPFGRIYYGDSGTATMHPQVLAFLKAQDMQGSPVAIDTSWLAIRHVDEIISFIPDGQGSFLMLVVSPAAAVEVLQDLYDRGLGDRPINRGLSSETTVQTALESHSFIDRNLRLQTDTIDPIVVQLKAAFGLTDNQIVPIPALFAASGAAWMPNMVNSIAVNGHLLVADPRGAMVNGEDAMQMAFQQRVARSGLQVHFLDDKYYHELRGNVHCALNATRQGVSQPFWEIGGDF